MGRDTRAADRVTVKLEGDPDGQDRILVRLPMIDNDANGDLDEGWPVWMRATTGGAFFRPEVGDEVIVGFINDDPARRLYWGC